MHACHVARNAEHTGHHWKDTKKENTSFPWASLVPRAFMAVTLFQLAERKSLAACWDEIDVGEKKDTWNRKEAVSG